MSNQRENGRTRPTGKPVLSRAAAAAVESLEARQLLTVFTVTSNADAGIGSLRQAMSDANANAGADEIRFALPAGATRIDVSTGLPQVTGSVTIDATTQPGYAGAPIVEVRGPGSNVPSRGFDLGGNAEATMTLRGLSIGSFEYGVTGGPNGYVTVEGSYVGLTPTGAPAGNHTNVDIYSGRVGAINGARNVIGNGVFGLVLRGQSAVVRSNYIGLRPDGVTPAPNVDGVTVYGLSNVIGHSGAAPRNVISGNTRYGIAILASGDGNQVSGNYIGTDATGTVAVPNQTGILLLNGAASIGGASTGDRNLIAGNTGDGIAVGGRVFAYGNWIGLSATGSPLGNGGNGIHIFGHEDWSQIGAFPNPGYTYDYANVIAHNGKTGILVSDPDGTASAASRVLFKVNSIYDNGLLGIDLSTGGAGPDGVTPNDPAPDADHGPNGLQNFPVLTAARTDGAGTIYVSGVLTSAPSKNHSIQFFASPAADPSGHGEGRLYLATADVITGAGGAATIYVPLAANTVPAGWVITAIATNETAGSSEFSPAVAVTAVVPLVVTTNADAGPGSLRQAILAANAAAGLDYIHFALPVTADQASRNIVLASPLPAVTDAVRIDGTTQPGFGGAVFPHLVGGPAATVGLVLQGDGSVVTGVAVTEFDDGIIVRGSGNRLENVTVYRNRDTAVTIEDGTRNRIVGSAFYSNGRRHIDLGATANDNQDADTGPNGLLNSPTLSYGTYGGGTVWLSGSYTGAPGTFATPVAKYTMQLYVEPADTGPRNARAGEYAQFGNQTVNLDYAATTRAWTYTGTPGLAPGARVFAIAVDADGNVSQDSLSVPLRQTAYYTVSNSADAGPNSLRAAIDLANASGLPTRILLSTSSVQLLTPLPPVTVPVYFDGAATVTAAAPAAAAAAGLVINANDTTVTGLALTGFRHGIVIDGSRNRVDAGARAYGNAGDGVRVVGGSGNLIDASRIANNGGLPINLGTDGRTPNDPLDADAGPNGLQNAPAVTRVERYGASLRVTGELRAAPNTTYVLDFYFGPASGTGAPAASKLAPAIVTTDAAGLAPFDLTLPTGTRPDLAWALTATATGPGYNTSEATAPVSPVVPAFTVDNANDAGPGSLRQAILDANASAIPVTIRFDPYMGLTPQIVLTTALPALDNPGMSLVWSYDGPGPLILRGPGGAVDGLILAADEITVGGIDLTGWRHGVVVRSSNNRVGSATEPLTIHGNSGYGVLVESGTGNVIRGNRIAADVLRPIALGTGGAAPNDPGDLDEGPNGLQNRPVLAKITRESDGTTRVRGEFRGAANATITLDFYLDGLTGAESHTSTPPYATATVTTDATGLATFAVPITLQSIAQHVVATATDAAGNTSETSAPAAVEALPLIVTTTADSGAGSLRQAILDANALLGPDQIHFAIGGGAGVYRIAPLSPLPEITEAVAIDATTQAGWAGAPIVELMGQGHWRGLSIAGSSDTETSAVRGLAVAGFDVGIWVDSRGATLTGNYVGLDAAGNVAPNRVGIMADADDVRIGGLAPHERNVISGNRAFGIDSVTYVSTTVVNNYVGTDPTGLVARPNDVGIRSRGDADVIGGTVAAARNVISGNTTAGMYAGTNSGSTVVQGNYIGVDVTGNKPLPNGVGLYTDYAAVGGSAPGAGNVISGNRGAGVYVWSYTWLTGNKIGVSASGAPMGNGGAGVEVHDMVTVGSTGPGEGNEIAYNAGAGVAVIESAYSKRWTSIRGNSIHDNGGLGIDLGTTPGVTPNDALDADAGPNGLQNFPVLAGVSSTGSSITISGALNSRVFTSYTIDFYASAMPDASGHSEGQVYLGSTFVGTDVNGQATFSTTLAASVPDGWFVSATATGPEPLQQTSVGTSEFSMAVLVGNPAPAWGIVRHGQSPSVTVRFVAPPAGGFLPSDLALRRTGDTADRPATSVTYDPVSRTATFTFATPLPDGNYTATLLRGQPQDTGAASTAPAYAFHVLTGDADGNRVVALNDLVILANHYGLAGTQTWADGDFDGNGTVGLNDLVILANRYGSVLPEGATGPTGPGASDDGAAEAEPVAQTTPDTTPDAPPANPAPATDQAAEPIVAEPVVSAPVVAEPVAEPVIEPVVAEPIIPPPLPEPIAEPIPADPPAQPDRLPATDAPVVAAPAKPVLTSAPPFRAGPSIRYGRRGPRPTPPPAPIAHRPAHPAPQTLPARETPTANSFAPRLSPPKFPSIAGDANRDRRESTPVFADEPVAPPRRPLR
ncbi:MAG TPA: hypothetical protein VEA69_25600 [Tepidisphaeraceae bacterium]|nr:hypothetical protein [Tepidisphaeraceae bacterium]